MLLKDSFFPTYVYGKDLNLDNNTMAHNVIEWSKKDEGVKKTNVNGWHSTTDMHKRPEYQPLVNELYNTLNEIWKEEWLDRKPFLGNMWANINYSGGYNRPHIHPNSLFSGVYYIKTPENCGHIWFTDPCGERHMDLPIMADKQQKPTHYWREVHYAPIEGRLIMFPGWLTHEVAHNMSDLKGENGWRVSVSFNFKQRWKKGMYVAPPKGHNSGGDKDLSSL